MLVDGEVVIVIGIICYIAVRVIFALKLKYKNSFKWLKELIRMLAVIYIFMVISVTLFPLVLGDNTYGINSFRSLNYTPLTSIWRDIEQIGTAYDGDTLFMLKLIVKNVGGNILLLMPLGFFAPMLLDMYKRLKNTLLLGLLVSLSIECLQFVELLLGIGMGRVVDIDDVICNVLGTVLGFLIYKLIFSILSKAMTPSQQSSGLMNN
ncbi:VanZ family protein [Pseudalkalibacillus hwajinpoensis]|uniref:VanZ family protein n=1 Tax=Guptibacillus hwajinpoensis TaxID=208199 RepID=A0A4U1MGA8_9BACL|nr:VanZ family protein [Pseudalkalibacillus hwajinpoensis]TKD69384.1 VanZ family protein [Pseudalkalibacillus hwajinpoensis]